MKKKISFVPDVNSDNLLDKEMDKSSYSNCDLTIVALPFSGHGSKNEKFFKISNLYCLHKNKLKEQLVKQHNESKNIDNKIVNEIEKTEYLVNNAIKENDDIFELNKKTHEEKMEKLNLMHVAMLEEINNNMLNVKRKRTNESVSDKPNYDKIMKKIRIMVLNNIIIFINKMIKIIYNNDIMKSILVKQLLPIDKSNLSHSTVGYDKIFLHKKLKEILSEKINGKYTNFPKNKNKLLIEDLIKSDIGGTYFKKLFELTFLDCIEHIRGTKKFVELNGLMEIDEMLNCEEFKIDKNDIDIFKFHILLYEKIIYNKKPRISKKIKNK